MSSTQRALIGLNVVGGTAVLASYAWGLLLRPELAGALWGGVPEAARGLYTVNMFLAAFGYLVFTAHIVFRLVPRSAELGLPSRPGLLGAAYLAILVPSALWLPLTAWMVASPGDVLWWLIRIVLALVACGAAALLAMMLRLEPRLRVRGHALAVVGLLPFCLQTVVLDAAIWPLYFPR